MDPKSLLQLVINLIKPVVPHVAGIANEELGYLVRYEKKLEELGQVAEKLRGQKKRVDDKVVEEEGRYGREIYEDVLVWLGQVETTLSEYDKFKVEEERELARCCLGHPPLNPRAWYVLSTRIKEIRKKVEQLLPERHDIISRWRGAPSMGDAFSNAHYENFVSRIGVMDSIMKALQDPRTRMIGVHGLAGVGKTTLVIEAARNAKKTKLFNVVVMANVTKSPDIRKIQGQIADMLGMKLEEESELARSVRIQDKLRGEDSTLIILDDLATKVDLQRLGIPSTTSGDGENNLILKEEKPSVGAQNRMETEQQPGSDPRKTEKTSDTLLSNKLKEKTDERYKYKVLLISEVRQVLVKQMEGNENSIFLVDVLSGKDGEALFKKTAGIGAKDAEFGKLATQIAKRCYGLPLSIVTTARALKNQSHSVWEDTHRTLERQKLTGTPEYSTKLGYQLLENDELKTIFLLCAQMGHDALVADLVKYCIGLGFLQGIYTVREARDRVQTLLSKLKQSGLLSDSYSSDRFTMQNLVRNAALSIASQERHVFALAKVKLDDWPDEDKLKRYTAIFLQHCDIIEEFPRSVRCPRLRVFHVDNSVLGLKIPDNFFQHMKELRVLVLIGFHLSPLPPSIRCLTKLRMLCLEQCTLFERLEFIGELKSLRILSFFGSDIESLPIELKNLSKLRIFDISNCSKLRVIPPNVISSLISLEELYMRNTSIKWKEEQKRQSENVSLLELGNLNQLTNLDLQIPSVAYLPHNLFFDNLCNYKIVIGSLNRYLETHFKIPEKYEMMRFLALQQKDTFDIHSHKGIKMLFKRVEILLLENINDVQHGLEDIFYALNLKGFPCLQHLSIASNLSIEYLINPKDRNCHEKTFPNLESLHLYKLEKIKEICLSSCCLLTPSFGKLKTIKIELCGKLENVFFFSMIELLNSLETIQVSECNSLKEIVRVETQNTHAETEKDIEVKFPELRSLTLQSLSKFIGFCPRTSSESRILFHEKVKVSKLERMELSSIQIEHIYVDKGCDFTNLIHLDVNGCENLQYLLSFSMAKNLAQLQSLFISECEKMKHILPQCDAKSKDHIFPNLKNIKLSNMKRLGEIWNSKVSAGSFEKLDTLIIDKCDKLDNVFPRYMEGVFKSVGTLRVTNCKSMKAIFDVANPGSLTLYYSTNLQDVHLETLPKLKHAFKCEKDLLDRVVLELENLQKIRVQDCNSLENIFPVSAVNTLVKLEYLMVCDCLRLREIVAKGEDANVINNPIEFKFPALTTVKISKLPKFKSLYPRAYTIRCPKLNDLSVELCDLSEPFGEETSDAQRKYSLFPQEVIDNLKSMQIELRHAKSSRKCYYRRNNLEELKLSRLINTDILYSFLHHNPNLRSLCLSDCFFEELVPIQRPRKIESVGVVPELKSLKLTNLMKLKKIGFERDAILQRIESLILSNCPVLETIAPPSVSFTHLTNLEVDSCGNLKYLMSSFIAKSMGQLRTMKVINCNSMKEIVYEKPSEEGEKEAREEEEKEKDEQVARKEQDEKEKDDEEGSACKADHTVIFRQLKALELVSLSDLESFCDSKNFIFEFPSLEKVVISACPKMKNFSQKLKSTPILQKVFVHEKGEKRYCWEGNLQATIKYMFENKQSFVGLNSISVSKSSDLQEFWQEGVVEQKMDLFYSLTSLKLENCQFEIPYAIPSSVLCCLESLQELHVRGCYNITGIFEMDDPKIRGTSFKLKNLTLVYLPALTHVWQHDKQGFLGFKNLQQVSVSSCWKLEAVFPAALARELKKLEELEVYDCDELANIVGKEEEAEEGEEKFVFPRLTKLRLSWLPKLGSSLTLVCPELNVLKVTDCNNLQLFQNEKVDQCSTSVIKQALFSDIKGISKVEEMPLDRKHSLVLQSLLSKATGDEQLGCLYILSLYDDVDGNSVFPSIFSFDKTPNLETLRVGYCGDIKEIIFTPQNPKDTILVNLKQLILFYLRELHSIRGLESLPKLEELSIEECPHLKNLGQSCSNLRELIVKSCDGLESLFTPSPTDAAQVEFKCLERITLQSLSSLKCFNSGNAALKLPELIRVDIVECHNMTSFSQAVVESPQRIQVSYNNSNDNDYDDLVLLSDLNIVVQWSLLHKSELHLADHAQWKKIWLGEVTIPEGWSSCKLRSLVVEGCDFVSNVVLPSHLIPFLGNLKELVVRKCNSVEAIFDVKGFTTHDNVVIPLKKLTLEHLPTLRHVWNKDPKGSCLSFPFLEEVVVEECEDIKSLFPASIVKDILNKLNVRNCVMLEEILVKDEGTKEAANEELIMLSKLTSMKLWDLPNLRCICSEVQILNWPALEDLDVYHCPKLKIFAINSQKSPDDIITYNQGNISTKKVAIPNLKHLSLHKEEVIMIEQRLVDVDLQKIKFLRLHGFNDESDVSPNVFFSKVSLPNMEKFGVMNSAFQEIFPSQSPADNIIHYAETFSQLKGLELRSLHMLKSIGFEHSWMPPLLENLQYLTIWECNSLTNLIPSIVSFSHLDKLDVKDCSRLEYLFTSSTSKTLVALSKMSISNCESLETVVVAEEGDKPHQDLMFKNLRTLSLSKLPKLESFYNGNSILNFSSWRLNVQITECKTMKTFSHGNLVYQYVKVEEINGIRWYGSDLNIAIRQQFKQEGSKCKHIVNSHTHDHLNSIVVLGDHPDVKEQWLGEASILDNSFFCKLRSLLVKGCHFISNAVLPSHLLPYLTDLEELVVQDCDYVEAIFEVIDTTTHDNRDSNMDVISLKKLSLKKLPKLRHIFNQDPKGVLTLPDLEQVIVDECENVVTLLPTVIAKRLHALERMYISNCKSLENVVAFEERVQSHEDVIFKKLVTLSLSSLPKLESFYTGKLTLNFPCLKYFCIKDCEDMKTFSHGSVVATYVSEAEIDGTYWYGNDLNTALHKQYEKRISGEDNSVNSLPHGLSVEIPRENFAVTNPVMEGIWLGKVPVPEYWFRTLRSMVVEGCQFLSNAIIPFHLLPFLCNLKKLEVRNCDSVEAIFDVKSPPINDNLNIIVCLKILILEQVTSLRYVWNMNLEGTHLSFPNLEEVIVHECNSVTSLFPASVVQANLTKLDVRNCVELVEIFTKDEEATQEVSKEVIMFPKLTSLKLWGLPNLRCICSGTHILNWPVLEDLDVDHSHILKIFATNFQQSPNSDQRGQGLFSAEDQHFVSTRKVATPNLKHMSLHKEDVIIEQGLVHVDLQSIETVRLQGCNDDLDAFSYVFLSKLSLPTMKKLGVMDSVFKEIFPSQRPDNMDYDKILSQLKGLELRSLHMLKSIGFEHSWVAPLAEILENLTVFGCTILTSLAPFTVYFSHLSELSVEDCATLKYLFTSSTAKSLVVLENMAITNCESLRTIVVAADEGDKPDENLMFEKIKTLSLSKLPRLGSFYTGNSTLNFPCFHRNSIKLTECKNLQTFSHGNVVAPGMKYVEIDGKWWRGDANEAVQRWRKDKSGPA